jgi:exosome complex component RRP4
MTSLKVENRNVVIPGELLAEGMDTLPGDNTYREDDKIYSKVLGLVSLSGRVVRITPLSGSYVPKVDDKIICRVIDIAMSGWRFNTGTAWTAMLNVKDATNRFIKREADLSQILAIDDYVIAKISKVTSQMLIDLSLREPGLQKIEGGRIIQINPQKVPRVIGKKGSMISMIKDKTGCNITVGQNGAIWVLGKNENLAEKAIKTIEARSHEEGLTEKMEKFLQTEVSS